MLYTSDSKTVVETKSYIGDFRDVLAAGETITSQAVTVTVFSGDDLNPANLLYGGIAVHPGWIDQKIRLGIPGNIYSIKFEVGTSLGNKYVKVTRLAILHEIGNAYPDYTNIYETSTLYPYILTELIKNNISVLSGRLTPAPYMIESIQNHINVIGGTLVVHGPISYTMPIESVQNRIAITSGTYVQYYVVSYTTTPETVKNNIAVISGTLVVYTPINYTTTPESVKNSISISGGTLGS